MQAMKDLIDQIVIFSKNKKQKNGFDKEAFESFINIFYSESKAHDFTNYSTEDLFNAALLSFDFFSNKKPKKFKIRICNPTLKKNGFESSRTFIDIVNDDMPFLVDSTVAYLDKYGVKVKNIIHPIYETLRDEKGNLKNISATKNSKQESIIQLHLDKITSEADLKMIEENIGKILTTVGLVVDDWHLMTNLVEKASKEIDKAKKISKEIDEIKEFLSWINGGNFILLGAKEFNIKELKDGGYSLEEAKNSGFGIFRSEFEDFRPEVVNSSFEEVTDSVANPYVIEVVKSRYRSRIHKITNAERIRVQKISSQGKVVGEFRFVGLFTSSAYHERIKSIPLVRDKIAKVIKDSGYIKGSHNYKDLVSVLEYYPRDELFQISSQDLLKNATGIVAICGRSQVKFFAPKINLIDLLVVWFLHRAIAAILNFAKK